MQKEGIVQKVDTDGWVLRDGKESRGKNGNVYFATI